jgi:hypothetical protein
VYVHAEARLASWIKLTGMPQLSEQFLAEDFCRRSISETFARCGIELIADGDQIGISHG